MTGTSRGSIFIEDAVVLEHRSYPGNQYALRLATQDCARVAKPGCFVHIRCSADIPMRRPLSIMRADPQQAWIEVLYKVVGPGLQSLCQLQVGDSVNLLGPIGNGFSVSPNRPRAILLGGGVGIPPLLFLAEWLSQQKQDLPLAFFGSEIPFPFDLCPSELSVAGTDPETRDNLSLLEAWGIPGRLASAAGIAGCYRGYVTDLANSWLQTLSTKELAACMIFACGPEPMLRAVKSLAANFDLPSQLCLEEYMACAVGGCAGCAVPVRTDDGVAMKRVCVDGPVFSGAQVYAD